jgi:hypothetical protein
MDFKSEILSANGDPEKLEKLYRIAEEAGELRAFKAAMQTNYEDAPDNVLYAAWFFRFQAPEKEEVAAGKGVNWLAAIPLSLLTGLLFWLLSDFETFTSYNDIPLLLHWWSPVASMSALIFLAITSKKQSVRSLAAGLGLAVLAVYFLLVGRGLGQEWLIEQYFIIALIHIPLLSWIAIGISVVGFKSSTADRFSFLIKSIEVMITAGLFLIAGVSFGGITIGMFAALGIDLPELWLRLVAAGGVGLLPVLAVATTYDPTRAPSEQDFNQGLSKFIATMMRLLMPLTLVVLAIYIVVIPFNFLEPFKNRDVLIVYNLMLFAILGLLMGATPIRAANLSPFMNKWLRSSIITVAALVVLVSVYALSATVFRTIEGGWTFNRLTIIGWNSINIGILAALLYKQLRVSRGQWVTALQSVFSLATNAYVAWSLFLMIIGPLLF